MALNVGDKAPSFKLKNQDAKVISLADLKGKPIVLYFYPKDDTSRLHKRSLQLPRRIPKIWKNES